MSRASGKHTPRWGGLDELLGRAKADDASPPDGSGGVERPDGPHAGQDTTDTAGERRGEGIGDGYDHAAQRLGPGGPAAPGQPARHPRARARPGAGVAVPQGEPGARRAPGRRPLRAGPADHRRAARPGQADAARGPADPGPRLHGRGVRRAGRHPVGLAPVDPGPGVHAAPSRCACAAGHPAGSRSRC